MSNDENGSSDGDSTTPDSTDGDGGTNPSRYNSIPEVDGPYGNGPFGDPAQAPFGGELHPIPGRIQAQDFDEGGEGVAYHETDPPADWAVDVRGTDIDFKPTPDDSGDLSVGRFHAEEWLEYSCAVEPGVYAVHVRCGTAHEGRQLSISLNGELLATADVPTTGWAAHETVTVTGVTIGGEAGERVLRISPEQDGVDVNWVEFERTGDLPPGDGGEDGGEDDGDDGSGGDDTIDESAHTTVTITAGDETAQVNVYGFSMSAVTSEVSGGLSESAVFSIGTPPQCAAMTGDGDRCSRNADVEAGERTCYQHDAGDIPDGGW